MPNLMDLLQGHLSPEVINHLSQQVGADPDQTQDATQGIMAALLGGLAKKTSTPDGAEALSHSLEKDHDGSILTNVLGAVSGTPPASVPAHALDGAGILGHILGGAQDQNNAVTMISNATGMDASSIMSMMLKLAPVLMGVLGQQKSANGLDASGLASMLSSAVSGMSQQSDNPLMQIAQQVLGSHSGGFFDMAKNLLGGLFK